MNRIVQLLILMSLATLAGCGPGPLVMKPNAKIPGPWCAPNQRAQIGDRTVGNTPYGPRHKQFLVDSASREHDPDTIAEQVWSYLERTGDAKTIQDAFAREGSYPKMFVISINPTVVVLATSRDPKLPQTIGTIPKRYYWLAQVYCFNLIVYQDGLQWFSPDLKQRPTPLTFNPAGQAEIPLTTGKILLKHEADKCTVVRE